MKCSSAFRKKPCDAQIFWLLAAFFYPEVDGRVEMSQKFCPMRDYKILSLRENFYVKLQIKLVRMFQLSTSDILHTILFLPDIFKIFYTIYFALLFIPNTTLCWIVRRKTNDHAGFERVYYLDRRKPWRTTEMSKNKNVKMTRQS